MLFRAPPPDSGLNVLPPPRPPPFGLPSAPNANSLSGSHTYPVASMASSSRYSTTGKVRPGISTQPHSPGTTCSKYPLNSSALTVADIATSLKSSRRAASLRKMTRRKSLSKSRSCTSSTMTWETPRRSGSDCSRLRRMPVVQKRSLVLALCRDSSLMLYPTVSPMRSHRSCATRSATAIALSLRGCVMITEHSPPRFASTAFSNTNCGTCVVLPQPVAPLTTDALPFSMQSSTSRRMRCAGRSRRLARMSRQPLSSALRFSAAASRALAIFLFAASSASSASSRSLWLNKPPRPASRSAAAAATSSSSAAAAPASSPSTRSSSPKPRFLTCLVSHESPGFALASLPSASPLPA